VYALPATQVLDLATSPFAAASLIELCKEM
jgi:hypothetical protein